MTENGKNRNGTYYYNHRYSKSRSNKNFFAKRPPNDNFFKNEPEKQTENCPICTRKICSIYCTKCKNFFVGRLKKTCPTHASVTLFSFFFLIMLIFNIITFLF